MLRKFTLSDDGELIEFEGSDSTWIEQLFEGNRQIAFDEIGRCSVSTVFLGFHLGFDKPKPFETLVRGSGGEEMHVRRYATASEADEGHRQIVSALRKDDLLAHNPFDGLDDLPPDVACVHLQASFEKIHRLQSQRHAEMHGAGDYRQCAEQSCKAACEVLKSIIAFSVKHGHELKPLE